MKDTREVVFRVFKNEAGNVEVSVANEEGAVDLPFPLADIAIDRLNALIKELLALKPALPIFKMEPLSHEH